jgi:predicted AAA+ superfamily ATPase
MDRISETLAGRATYVSLWPMTRREQAGLGTAGIWGELFSQKPRNWPSLALAQPGGQVDWRPLVRAGGYPIPAHEMDSESARALWFRGYVQTYLERDLRDLASIEHLADFRRLMRIASLRVGNVVNQAELARDAGLSRATAHRYLNLLETSFQLIRIEPYAVNRTKRLVKSPKLYWSDPGLALFLSDELEPRGAHLENLVVMDLLAWRDAQHRAPQILYWRTSEGAEVDFVIEHRGELLAVEIKASARPSFRDAQHLQTFRQEYGAAVRGALLLHDGPDTYWISEGVLAVPWWRIV